MIQRLGKGWTPQPVWASTNPVVTHSCLSLHPDVDQVVLQVHNVAQFLSDILGCLLLDLLSFLGDLGDHPPLVQDGENPLIIIVSV